MRLTFPIAIVCMAFISLQTAAQTPTLQQVTTAGATSDQTIHLSNQLVLEGLFKGLVFSTNGGRWLFRHEGAETGSNAGSNFAVHAYGDDGAWLRNNLFINRATGHVGIQTESPQTALHVAGDVTNRITNFTHNNAGIAWLGRGGSITGGWVATPDIFAITTSKDIALGGWGKSDGLWRGAAIYINSDNGNVLINKTSQTNTAYKLDVAGNVRANRIVVNTTGADFVFAPGYVLPSLTEVERFISRHRHLPGIAPADSMQQHGLDVGDQQTKLLQKIEELTLYVIDLHKKVEDQRSTIAQQAKELDAIKERFPAAETSRKK